MKTRPVFESYEEFVYSLNNAIYEAENGNVNALNNLLGGLIKEADSGRSSVKTQKDRLIAINELMSTMFTKDSASEIVDFATNISDYFASSEAGVKLNSAYLTKGSQFSYEYLVNGTARSKGEPELYDDGTLGTVTRQPSTESSRVSINTILYSIYLYNVSVLDSMVNKAEGAKEKTWKQGNYGVKAKSNFEFPFLTIKDPGKGEMLEVVPYTADTNNGNPGGEYGVQFPIFVIEKSPTDSKNLLDVSYYEEVIKPAGNDTEVKDKPFNSSGVDFFEENSVKIGEDGMAALKSIISQFNSISSIVVSGGASSKPTDYRKTNPLKTKDKELIGNEALAYERREAGITALGTLKKDGVEQLKNASITPGEAKVQSAAEESDPANQQVSFKISGRIKNVDGTTSAPVTITRTEDIYAQKVFLQAYYYTIGFNIA
jgi:hypothetical protein